MTYNNVEELENWVKYSTWKEWEHKNSELGTCACSSVLLVCVFVCVCFGVFLRLVSGFCVLLVFWVLEGSGSGFWGFAPNCGRTRVRSRRKRRRGWCWFWRQGICTYPTEQLICLPSSSPCWCPARSNIFSALATCVSRCFASQSSLTLIQVILLFVFPFFWGGHSYNFFSSSCNKFRYFAAYVCQTPNPLFLKSGCTHVSQLCKNDLISGFAINFLGFFMHFVMV